MSFAGLPTESRPRLAQPVAVKTRREVDEVGPGRVGGRGEADGNLGARRRDLDLERAVSRVLSKHLDGGGDVRRWGLRHARHGEGLGDSDLNAGRAGATVFLRDDHAVADERRLGFRGQRLQQRSVENPLRRPETHVTDDGPRARRVTMRLGHAGTQRGNRRREVRGGSRRLGHVGLSGGMVGHVRAERLSHALERRFHDAPQVGEAGMLKQLTQRLKRVGEGGDEIGQTVADDVTLIAHFLFPFVRRPNRLKES